MIKQGKIVNQTNPDNRKYYYFLIFALAVVSIFTFEFYLTQKKQNQALKIKIIMLKKERKIPKPWGRLLAPAPVTLANIAPNKKKLVEQSVTTKAAAPLINQTNTIESIKEKSTEELALLVNTRMNSVKTETFKDLEFTIALADEIISREPDTYSAYKAKLIALLVEEGKWNIAIEDNLINSLLEEMARYDLGRDVVTKKEAELITTANDEIRILSEQVDTISNQRLAAEIDLESVSIDDPVYKTLESIRADLTYKEQDALKRLSNKQLEVNQTAFPEENYLNEDIVQIPFLRMMAKGDYQGMISSAEAFIQQFPTSQIGYLYLVLVLEKEGRKAEAIDLISKSNLTNNEQSSLMVKLEKARSEDPKKYWDKLFF